MGTGPAARADRVCCWVLAAALGAADTGFSMQSFPPGLRGWPPALLLGKGASKSHSRESAQPNGGRPLKHSPPDRPR